jgi:hypothetical protein
MRDIKIVFVRLSLMLKATFRICTTTSNVSVAETIFTNSGKYSRNEKGAIMQGHKMLEDGDENSSAFTP